MTTSNGYEVSVVELPEMLMIGLSTVILLPHKRAKQGADCRRQLLLVSYEVGTGEFLKKRS